MRIAVPTDDGTSIAEHFGRSKSFLVFEIENGRIKSRETRPNAQQHSHSQGNCTHGAPGAEAHGHAGILSVLAGCDVVICAGMGSRAAEAIKADSGAEVIVTAAGPAEEAVAAHLAGTLAVRAEGFCHCKH